MTQSCPNISLTQFKKPIRDCYLMMHDVGGNFSRLRQDPGFTMWLIQEFVVLPHHKLIHNREKKIK
ncbi:hypothetical protein BpHYR1_029967 [Brachionus plicatilis]|uniref:Uncharacterized protein n=1 Tax=Brachionus plicatilis TaxID=10195 RepID=A0A3M7PWL8_BRAPC|nr:hypothetical protein BpHYR1_029967 [Brachionus plicatilis]